MTPLQIAEELRSLTRQLLQRVDSIQYESTRVRQELADKQGISALRVNEIGAQATELAYLSGRYNEVIAAYHNAMLQQLPKPA